MKPIHSFIGIFILGIGVCLFVFFQLNQDEVYHVDLDKVFHSYAGTQEYKLELDHLDKKQNAILDSIKLEVLALENNEDMGEDLINNKKEYYYYVRENFEKDRQIKTQEIDLKLWDQINQYVQGFAIKKGVSYIHGKRSNGDLVYALPSLDLTEELILFINKKYEGE